MPVGFQSFDAQGRLTCDLTDRLAKVMGSGSVVVTYPNTNITVYFAGLVPGGEWYVYTTERTMVRIFNGYFIITRVDQFSGESSTVYYSVIKQ